MKISLRAKSDLEEAREEEEKLRLKLEKIEKNRRALEERTATTPIITADVPRPPEPAAPIPAGQEAPKPSPADERLKQLLAGLVEEYGGAFPEMGPSGHQEVTQMLLLGIYGELKKR